MAALVGDLVPDLSRFHDMIVSPSSSRQNQRQQQQQQQQQQHHKYSPQRQGSHSHSRTQPPRDSPHRRSSSRPRASAALTSRRGDSSQASRVNRRNSSGEAPRFPSDKTCTVETAADTTPTGRVPLKFPSPPPSSSPQVTDSVSPADDAKGVSMASQTGEVAPAPYQTLRNVSTSMNADARLQQPSPPSSQSQSFHLPGSSLASSSSFDRVESPPTQQTTQQTSQEPQQTVVHVRDLAHMQSLADAKMLGGNNSTSLDSGNQIKYEISGMPIADVIEMVAALLTKITTTNDLQHDAMQRNVAHQQQANQSSDSGSHMSPLSHSVLAFHGKNVPAITILSYLSRIHKYCPTTYEVFLSLLVYFDRMTERVNEMVMRGEQISTGPASHSQPIPPSASQRDTTMRDNAHESDESDSDLADDDEDDDDDDGDDEMVDSPKAAAGRDDNSGVVATTDEQAAAIVNPATYFVVDSFNIHRLIISGVTCASKFFSDVFYTNSRYAKVGGLPLAELNHLEIQFLVLNDFRLAVPVEDLEAYATMLVEFYAREVMLQKSATAGA